MYTSLLQRQLKKYIKTELKTAEWQELLEAINRSYEHYERDRLLSQRSLEVSTGELRELARELSDREARLRKILDKASDGILIFSEENKVIVCNDAVIKLFGLNESAQSLIGKDISLFKTKPFLISEVTPNISGNLLELKIVRNDDTYLPVEVSISEIEMNEKKYTISVLRDISIHIEHQIVLKKEIELQRQLVDAARGAGMMQVATSVLHNVGNVLNSVNIGLKKLEESFAQSNMHNLPKIASMIGQNRDNLDHFLTKDEKGKYVIDYILKLGEYWQKESESTLSELKYILNKLQHIKNIINTQQAVSHLTSIKENIEINRLIGDFLYLHHKDIQELNIIFEFKPNPIPVMSIERSKFLQILENLIRNSIDALKEKNGMKKIIISTNEVQKGLIEIVVEDNGCGIDPNNLLKIFSFGYTTKAEGHGFGLHGSSLLAKELGGQLTAYSTGLGQGAKFTLTIPYSERRK